MVSLKGSIVINIIRDFLLGNRKIGPHFTLDILLPNSYNLISTLKLELMSDERRHKLSARLSHKRKRTPDRYGGGASTIYIHDGQTEVHSPSPARFFKNAQGKQKDKINLN